MSRITSLPLLVVTVMVAIVLVPCRTRRVSLSSGLDRSRQVAPPFPDDVFGLGKDSEPAEEDLAAAASAPPGGRRKLAGTRANNRFRHGGGFHRKSKGKKLRGGGGLPKERKPNIILIVTDDQDVELGSMNFMPRALRILRDGGSHFTNSFVTTPMCCPSRSSMLTGMYVHNHHVFTNNDNCSSPYWQQTHETRSFATYLNNVGYRTGFFGKYLNEYNGTYIPPGWREWSGLIRNSRFYNYSVNVNGKKFKHSDDYHKDYYPDLITNHSLSFFRQSKQLFVNKPVMMVLSYPAPHGPEDAAPQYQNMFSNVTTHRTPSWNSAPNPDKQWILRQTGPMEPIHIKFTDVLHQKRLQTLQSVDEALERLYRELVDLGELNNTYIFYTSDHGYHLGQFGLVKGKAMPFEFDIKVPFYVRGPNVPQGTRIPNIVLNLDLAPTFLDIAGVEVPEHMDGKSVLKLISDANELASSDRTNIEKILLKKRQWRDTVLIESAGRQNAGVEKKKMPLKPYKNKPMKPVHSLNFPVTTPTLTKEQRLSQICRSPSYKPPCTPFKKWECVHDGVRWRMQKCRINPGKRRRLPKDGNCVCPGDDLTSQNLPAFLDPTERRRQRAFIRDHVSKDFKPQFIGTRSRRSLEFDLQEVLQLHDILMLKYENPELEVIDFENNSSSPRTEVGLSKTTRSIKIPLVSTKGCQLVDNNIVNCSDEVYNNLVAWRENKNLVDDQIKFLKEKLGELKDIRKHLKQKRPGESYFVPGDKNFHLDTFDKTNLDYDGTEEPELDEEDGECVCDARPFGKKNGRRKGGRRDELREMRRRQKEERMRRIQDKLKRQERKNRRKVKYENYTCNIEKMNCFVHDNDHWKTPPLWFDGPFCFCQNSNNNTYWCLRTVNSTHNFLFCKFITGFLSYYDLNTDPYEMTNIVKDIPFPILDELHQQLEKMRKCSGAKSCTNSAITRAPLRGVPPMDSTTLNVGSSPGPPPTLADAIRGLLPRHGRQTSSLLGKGRRKQGNSSRRGSERASPLSEAKIPIATEVDNRSTEQLVSSGDDDVTPVRKVGTRLSADGLSIEFTDVPDVGSADGESDVP